MPGARLRHGGRRNLTRREKQVLVAIADGKTDPQIASELYCATETVRTHAKHIRQKLNATTRAEAVAKGFRDGTLR